ncbi:MAG: hypothetical protein ACPG7F_16785 [Aggregatilineales bacterium]
MSEKTKRAAGDVPDKQLARVFNFTADDLAANQAGYMSGAQMHGLPVQLRWLIKLLPAISERDEICVISGRVQLRREHRQIISHFRVDTSEHFYARFGTYTREFILTPVQFRILNEGVTYRLYYRVGVKRILSIERIHEKNPA